MPTLRGHIAEGKSTHLAVDILSLNMERVVVLTDHFTARSMNGRLDNVVAIMERDA
jgi:hypothetical protein